MITQHWHCVWWGFRRNLTKSVKNMSYLFFSQVKFNPKSKEIRNYIYSDLNKRVLSFTLNVNYSIGTEEEMAVELWKKLWQNLIVFFVLPHGRTLAFLCVLFKMAAWTPKRDTHKLKPPGLHSQIWRWHESQMCVRSNSHFTAADRHVSVCDRRRSVCPW